MKQLLFTGLLILALEGLVSAQPGTTYTNNGSINAPPDRFPVVDATNFLNNGLFNIGLPNVLPLNLFDFSDVLNFTNHNVMACNTGFRFDTEPSGSGSATMAANFINLAPGSVAAGSATNGFFAFSTNGFIGGGAGLAAITIGESGFPLLVVSATNIVSTGLLDVGESGIINLGGANINLERGTVHVEGFDESTNSFSST